jgi:hypothetical protein
LQKINNSINYSNNVIDQLKRFEEFADQQQLIVSDQNVTLYSGGTSSKSSVFAGVQHNNRADYYKGVQNLKENIDDLKNNKRKLDLETERSFNLAQAEASGKYNEFSVILNNAMGYYNYATTVSSNNKLAKEIASAKGESKRQTNILGGWD